MVAAVRGVPDEKRPTALTEGARLEGIGIRKFVLEQLLLASARIKGWEVRNGAELLVEAIIVEEWIKSGRVKAKEEKGGAQVRAAETNVRVPKKARIGRR